MVENNMPEEQLNRKIDQRSTEVVKNYLKSLPFTNKRLTDTPTDALQVVNRNYVNLSGIVASRPSSSVATIGQSYFATDTNIPMVYNGTNWRNGVGSVVAS